MCTSGLNPVCSLSCVDEGRAAKKFNLSENLPLLLLETRIELTTDKMPRLFVGEYYNHYITMAAHCTSIIVLGLWNIHFMSWKRRLKVKYKVVLL